MILAQPPQMVEVPPFESIPFMKSGPLEFAGSDFSDVMGKGLSYRVFDFNDLNHAHCSWLTGPKKSWMADIPARAWKD
jgi:hypothetical protein